MPYLLLSENCPNMEFFFGPYFPVFKLNMEIYGVNLRIQSNTLRWEAFHADATFINTIIESLNYSRLRFFP